MFNRRKSVVGLDIGSSEVKAVELTQVGDSLKITGFGHARIQSPEQTATAVLEVLERASIKTRRVCTAVSGRSVIVRYVNLPHMDESELKGALRYEADKYIPFDVDEVAIDGQKLEDLDGDGDTEREMKVLLVAAKKSLLQEHVNLIQEMGLQPVAIDIDTFALTNAYELRSRNSPRVEDDDRVVALIDVGATKTTVSILKGSTSYFSREIYLAGDDLSEAISRQLHVERNEAEELKRNPQGRESELEDAMLPVLDDLANEIHLSFDYFENQFDREVAEVFLSGGAVQTPGLQMAFERVFDLKATVWDPTEHLELRGEKIDVEELRAHASQLPIAVGLGARLLDSQ
ncbi:MAG: type IV pilus assembly protein PilM [Planctomycetota bacterium]